MSTVALEQILVPTDFSEYASLALTYARALADSFGARLHLLHAIQDPFDQPWANEVYEISHVDYAQAATREAKAQLAALLSEDERRKYDAQLVTIPGPPYQAIVDYAAREAIDLIVMGTHGRGMVAHLLIGSVAEKVVRKAPCPVLTVRPGEREFVAP